MVRGNSSEHLSFKNCYGGFEIRVALRANVK